jgi:hypothetical protein
LRHRRAAQEIHERKAVEEMDPVVRGAQCQKLVLVFCAQAEAEDQAEQTCAALHVRIPRLMTTSRPKSFRKPRVREDHPVAGVQIDEGMAGAVFLPDDYDSHRRISMPNLVMCAYMMQLAGEEGTAMRSTAFVFRGAAKRLPVQNVGREVLCQRSASSLCRVLIGTIDTHHWLAAPIIPLRFTANQRQVRFEGLGLLRSMDAAGAILEGNHCWGDTPFVQKVEQYEGQTRRNDLGHGRGAS